MDVNTVLILAYVDDYFKANKIAAELSKKNFTVRMEFPDSFDFDAKIRASLLRADAVIYIISSQVLASDKYYELHGIVQENQRMPKPEVYVALNNSIDDLFLDIYKHDEYSDDILLRADDYRMELEQKNVICQSSHFVDDIEKLLKSLKEETIDEKAIEPKKEEEDPLEEVFEEPVEEAVEETSDEEVFEEPVEEAVEETPALEVFEEPVEEAVEETPALVEATSEVKEAEPKVIDMDAFNEAIKEYGKDNYLDSFKLFLKTKDLPLAEYYLGYHYLNGLGVDKDEELGVEYYIKSVNDGCDKAYSALGDAYYYGFGVAKDDLIAAKYYKSAAARGDNDALFHLANCYYYGKGEVQNHRKALEIYQTLADEDNIEACYHAGCMYFLGKGCKQSYKNAYYLLQKAAAAGHPKAMNDLGTLYRYGLYIEPNIKIAIDWFNKAAKAGRGAAYKNSNFNIWLNI